MSDAKPAKFAPKLVPPNTLYYGDNLNILRRYVDDGSVEGRPLRPATTASPIARKASTIFLVGNDMLA